MEDTVKIVVPFISASGWLVGFSSLQSQAPCDSCRKVLVGLFTTDGMGLFASRGRIFQRRPFISVFPFVEFSCAGLLFWSDGHKNIIKRQKYLHLRPQDDHRTSKS